MQFSNCLHVRGRPQEVDSQTEPDQDLRSCLSYSFICCRSSMQLHMRRARLITIAKREMSCLHGSTSLGLLGWDLYPRRSSTTAVRNLWSQNREYNACQGSSISRYIQPGHIYFLDAIPIGWHPKNTQTEKICPFLLSPLSLCRFRKNRLERS